MDDLFTKVVAPFLNSGIAGAILLVIFWKFLPAIEAFKQAMWSEMAKNRDEMRNLEDAFDRATKTNLLRLIASPLVASSVKESAAEILKDVDSASAARSEAKDPAPA